MSAARRILFLALIMVAGLYPVARAQDRDTMTVGGTPRWYLLHVPANLRGPAPLLLAFHGAGTSPVSIETVSGFDALADRYGFIVAYPAGEKHRWNDGRITYPAAADDLGFASSLVSMLQKQYQIDPRRIYAAGFSNGATMSEAVACNLPNQFAAVAVISGVIPDAIIATCTRPISVIQFNGTADPVFPYAGGMLRVPGLPGGMMSSVDRSVGQWVKADRCSGLTPLQLLPPLDPNRGMRAMVRTATGCTTGKQVIAYVLKGQGHAWPGSGRPKASDQIDASSTIISFLLAQHLQ